jgi:hypothetical protein
MEEIGLYCSNCKNKNKPGAVLCAFCGVLLNPIIAEPRTTSRMEGQKDTLPPRKEEVVSTSMAPTVGAALYIAGFHEAFTTITDKEFIIGRKTEQTTDPVVDLSGLESLAIGVSRRHLMVRSTENGYEVKDLNSSNGSWLNDQRMVPDKFYPLPSGAQLRIGGVQLHVLYQPVHNQGKES